MCYVVRPSDRNANEYDAELTHASVLPSMRDAETRCFARYSTTFCWSKNSTAVFFISTAAWAAASRATGSRNGLQET
jgi:hypothetical protein